MNIYGKDILMEDNVRKNKKNAMSVKEQLYLI